MDNEFVKIIINSIIAVNPVPDGSFIFFNDDWTVTILRSTGTIDAMSGLIQYIRIDFGIDKYQNGNNFYWTAYPICSASIDLNGKIVQHRIPSFQWCFIKTSNGIQLSNPPSYRFTTCHFASHQINEIGQFSDPICAQFRNMLSPEEIEYLKQVKFPILQAPGLQPIPINPQTLIPTQNQVLDLPTQKMDEINSHPNINLVTPEIISVDSSTSNTSSEITPLDTSSTMTMQQENGINSLTSSGVDAVIDNQIQDNQIQDNPIQDNSSSNDLNELNVVNDDSRSLSPPRSRALMKPILQSQQRSSSNDRWMRHVNGLRQWNEERSNRLIEQDEEEEEKIRERKRKELERRLNTIKAMSEMFEQEKSNQLKREQWSRDNYYDDLQESMDRQNGVDWRIRRKRSERYGKKQNKIFREKQKQASRIKTLQKRARNYLKKENSSMEELANALGLNEKELIEFLNTENIDTKYDEIRLRNNSDRFDSDETSSDETSSNEIIPNEINSNEINSQIPVTFNPMHINTPVELNPRPDWELTVTPGTSPAGIPRQQTNRRTENLNNLTRISTLPTRSTRKHNEDEQNSEISKDPDNTMENEPDN